MAWAQTYDTNTPANEDDPAEADDRMREIKAALQERLNVALYFPLTGTEVSDTDAGEVRQIPFHAPIVTPTAVANKAFLYPKDSGAGYIELYFLDEQSNEIQITNQGYILLDSGMLSNDTYLQAVNNAGDGTVDIIKVNTDDIVVVPDGAQLATDAAPTEDEGLVNKKYVDDNAVFTPATYASEQSVTFPNGLIWKQGTQECADGATITFTDAFPNAILRVNANMVITAGYGVGIGSKAVGSFKVYHDAGGTRTIDWVAWGR